MGEMLAALVPFLLIFRTTICIVTGPSSLRLEYKVGESAKLMWNSTKRITQVRFGLYDFSGNDISTQFVFVNVIAGVQYTNLSNTAAERYAGRVQWVGNLTLGRAWFTVINLQQKDFEVVYAAKIRESGDTAEPSFPVNLTLSRVSTTPTSTSSPTTTPTTTPDSTSPSPTTTPTPTTTPAPEVTTTPTQKPKTPDWVIAVIVIYVIVLVVVIVITSCYCFCPKYLQDFRICICRCCPKCCQDCCKRICCCCPKCFLDEETPPPAKEGHDMKPTSVASEKKKMFFRVKTSTGRL